MKLSTPFLLLVAAAGLVEATGHDGLSRMAARHHEVARHSDNNGLARRAKSDRCKVRPTSTLVSSSTHTSSPHKTTSTKKSAPSALTNNDKSSSGSKSSSNNSGSKGNSGSGKSVASNVSGLVRVTDWKCGDSGATKDITATHGPNGNIDWMNCGLTSGGWNPPKVTVSDLVTVDLYDALKDPNSPFKACNNYIDTFVKYANQHGIPPIVIASIAMQESTCNQHEVGGGGEQGIMQISKDKCGGAPGGNCQDVDFNIRTGTAFFANTLNENGGNILKTLGNYNGWPSGMTVDSATKARWSSCCLCQNNMDYLVQNLNGWYLNKDPYSGSIRIGKYFNLDDCN